MKNDYGEYCSGHTVVNNWYKNFRQGKEIVKNAPKPEQVHNAIINASIVTANEMIRNNR